SAQWVKTLCKRSAKAAGNCERKLSNLSKRAAFMFWSTLRSLLPQGQNKASPEGAREFIAFSHGLPLASQHSLGARESPAPRAEAHWQSTGSEALRLHSCRALSSSRHGRANQKQSDFENPK